MPQAGSTTSTRRRGAAATQRAGVTEIDEVVEQPDEGLPVNEGIEELEPLPGDDIPEEDIAFVDDSTVGSGVPEPDQMTTTQSLMSTQGVVQDLGVEELSYDHEVVGDPQARQNELVEFRVNADVGPVYYCEHLLEFKQGRRYRAPFWVLDYLERHGLVWH